MDNKVLDEVLVILRDKYPNGILSEDFPTNHPDVLKRQDWQTIKHFLNSKKYIYDNFEYPSRFHILITAEGIKFINDGGFSADASYREETLQVAKESRDYSKHSMKYAKWAFIVSIIGIAVSIVIYFLSKPK